MLAKLLSFTWCYYRVFRSRFRWRNRTLPVGDTGNEGLKRLLCAGVRHPLVPWEGRQVQPVKWDCEDPWRVSHSSVRWCYFLSMGPEISKTYQDVEQGKQTARPAGPSLCPILNQMIFRKQWLSFPSVFHISRKFHFGLNETQNHTRRLWRS